MAHRTGLIQANTPLIRANIPAQALVRALGQAEKIITRTLRPTCVECGSRMIWGADKPRRRRGGVTLAEQAEGRWREKAAAALEGERQVMEASARNLDRIGNLDRRLEELEGALDSAGRPGKQARVLTKALDLIRRLARTECPSCHREIAIGISGHKPTCDLAELEGILEDTLSTAEPTRKEPAPTLPAPVVKEVARARVKAVEDTKYGAILTAVRAGKLKEPFTAKDIRIALKMPHSGSLLVNHAVGNQWGAPSYFVRVAHGLYRLKEEL